MRPLGIALFFFASMLLFMSAAVGQAKQNDDIRYLVIRRAGRPEKNYYELAKQVRLVSGDVITRDPSGIGYDVHGIWKVRVQRTTDSKKNSESAKDATYVLIYERDPDLRFCARHYAVSSLPSGARRVDYTDCEDGRRYSFEMARQWPRPLVIYEVEILDRKVLRELWEEQTRGGSLEPGLNE